MQIATSIKTTKLFLIFGILHSFSKNHYRLRFPDNLRALNYTPFDLAWVNYLHYQSLQQKTPSPLFLYLDVIKAQSSTRPPAFLTLQRATRRNNLQQLSTSVFITFKAADPHQDVPLDAERGGNHSLIPYVNHTKPPLPPFALVPYDIPKSQIPFVPMNRYSSYLQTPVPLWRYGHGMINCWV